MCLVIDKLFDDKRIAVSFLMVWLLVVIVVFKDIGMLETKFMAMGPSPATVFMGMPLDTWYKWWMVALFTLVNTSINDFMSDALSPWILNTITDHKTKYIPYSKSVCLLISQMWSVYCNIMGVFGLFLAMTQVDFVLIKIAADLTVSMYTNLKFMRGKVTCRDRYLPHHDSEMGGGTELSSFHSDAASDSHERPILSKTRHRPASPPTVFSIEETPDRDVESGPHEPKNGHEGA
jgi:hypothetical protein